MADVFAALDPNEAIRYGQAWEDADLLCAAHDRDQVAGGELVAICASGDNALALLTLDPARVIAADLSAAQLACLALRIGAWRALSHADFLGLMGARPAPDRAALLARALDAADPAIRPFWRARAEAVAAWGLGGAGRFEAYFRLFARWVAPLAPGRPAATGLLAPRDRAGRAAYFDARIDGWRWRLAARIFFSRFVMSRLGRDPAFFAHAQGGLAEHVLARLRHAAVDLDPTANPYLRWIMTGTHADALPLPWRRPEWETIRDRLDRVALHLGPVETAPARGAAGFYLSDIFEYMDEAETARVYGALLAMGRPGARLVCWNMMVPRRAPPVLAARVTRRAALEDRLKRRDKAFFYSDFVVEEMV